MLWELDQEKRIVDQEIIVCYRIRNFGGGDVPNFVLLNFVSAQFKISSWNQSRRGCPETGTRFKSFFPSWTSVGTSIEEFNNVNTDRVLVIFLDHIFKSTFLTPTV